MTSRRSGDPYPELEPDEHGMLDVGDGQLMYWQASGDAGGKPAVILHGGPGAGISSWARRQLDLAAYRIIEFDQRGCGRSTPHAGDLGTDLASNTTHHLIADIERLREHVGVDRWLVHGASWGVTLALAYAERHPDRVTEMVLASITMTPVLSLEEGYEMPNPRWADRRYRLAFARRVTRYFRNAAWLEDDELLRNAGRLAGIDAVLVHGRLDLAGPPDVAWHLAKAWPAAELHLVSTGHTGGDEMRATLIEATDRFRTSGRPS